MKNLFKALANFQQEIKPIHKNTTGYGYRYSDLTKIFEMINPLLKKHGLGFMQPLNGTCLKTIVFHIESGEQVESCVDIPQGVTLKGMNEFQVLGSGITYLRRYSLGSLLGLVTDDDIDTAGEQVKKEASKKSEQKQKLKLSEHPDKWSQAVKYLQNGGALEDITKKYTLTEKEQTKLIEDCNG